MEIERLEYSPETFRLLKAKALSLQSELDEAESQLNDMRETYLNAAKLWTAFDHSPAQTLIFALLMSRPFATKGMIHAVIDGRRLDRRQDYTDIDRKLIEVFVCRMRQRLRPYGIEIKTVWGQGYQITGEMKVRVSDLTESGALRVKPRARAITRNNEDFVNHFINHSSGYSKTRVFSEYAE